MSVHWAKADIRLRASGSDFDPRVRPQAHGGVVKSLALTGAGPVGLLCTQKVGIKYKKPLRDPSEPALRKGTRGEEESNDLSAVRVFSTIFPCSAIRSGGLL